MSLEAEKWSLTPVVGPLGWVANYALQASPWGNISPLGLRVNPSKDRPGKQPIITASDVIVRPEAPAYKKS